MKVLSILFVVAACGGGSKKPEPAPINNTAKQDETLGLAKVVQRTNQGGVIELGNGDRGAALTKANDEMAKHCGSGNYTITQEGEEAVGDSTDPCAGRMATAWRVHYVCNGSN